MVPDPQLVNGQGADTKLGLYLDFGSASPPQPIRGGFGGMDPGPRCTRIATINDQGQNYVDDICASNVWFFPAGFPHSIQALDEGTEFLLVFDSGEFNENATLLVSELFMHNPVEVHCT
ncbi:hypothetical protein B0H67DRAFT_645781 [Lasiosphaeris hirsuta]|uniref:Cupin type-1 domain-containing protein n=1 Tax=Lasiosphaeris hirsuta TaxID=260670 RepID=A0AA40AHW1_9PEZI|nr:hypothetical protein B0H67DRAFT_645781 [Lasiosphaeris hirsuta]